MDRTGKAGLFSTRQLRQTHANLNYFYYTLAQAGKVLYEVSFRK